MGLSNDLLLANKLAFAGVVFFWLLNWKTFLWQYGFPVLCSFMLIDSRLNPLPTPIAHGHCQRQLPMPMSNKLTFAGVVFFWFLNWKTFLGQYGFPVLYSFMLIDSRFNHLPAPTANGHCQRQLPTPMHKGNVMNRGCQQCRPPIHLLWKFNFFRWPTLHLTMPRMKKSWKTTLFYCDKTF